MNLAMLKTFLTHWIATEAMAKNANSCFGLTATFLPLAKLFFRKALLKLLRITRRNGVENVLFFEIFLVGFTVEASVTAD